MPVNRIHIAAVFLLTLAAGMYSCKDMGHVVARSNVLTATTFLVTLNPGGSASVTISGGNPPYRISRDPSASLASATLTNNANGTGTLLIQAVSSSVSGTTSVKIKDSDTHDSSLDSPMHEENEIEIEIRVSPAATGVSFSTQIQPIFTASCVNAGCHPGGGAPFSLASGSSYASLVNVPASTGPCAGDMRVVPNNPGASGLVKRIEGNCGNLMPLGGSALPSGSIQLIRDWISQGALNN